MKVIIKNIYTKSDKYNVDTYYILDNNVINSENFDLSFGNQISEYSLNELQTVIYNHILLFAATNNYSITESDIVWLSIVLSNSTPPGLISMWHGLLANIPTGTGQIQFGMGADTSGARYGMSSPVVSIEI